ncbi:MAG: HD domain-containing phosphohydrolase [Nitrospirota bacterium]
MITKLKKDGRAYLAIHPELLIIGSSLPFDVYVRVDDVIKPLFKKGMRLAPTTRTILKQKGIAEIYVDNSQSAALLLYLRNKLRGNLPDFDLREFLRYSSLKEEHHQIERALLSPGTQITFSLFLLSGLSVIPLVEATVANPAKIDKRTVSAQGDLIIKKSDIPLYNKFIDTVLSSALVSERGEWSVKEIALREKSKIVIRNVIDDPRSGERIKEAHVLVTSIVDCILNRRSALYNLLSIEQYDYYTYTHSVNVGVLSIGLGIETGMDKKEAHFLGLGALLHDVGKNTIPPEILNKEGKLSDIEYQLIRTHVEEARRILSGQRAFPLESFSAVLEHHERLSGKGYPRGLSADRISLFGRITAIADCYDALTTQRPYRTAFTPFYALSVLVNEIEDYDPALLERFVLMLGKL